MIKIVNDTIEFGDGWVVADLRMQVPASVMDKFIRELVRKQIEDLSDDDEPS